MKFFKVFSKNDKPDYYAARSKEHMLAFFGDKKEFSSVVNCFGYRPETLEEITEKEATKAKDYRGFALERELCIDGTYLLGAESTPDEYAPEQYYLMPKTTELN